MSERDIFNELLEGMSAWSEHNRGKKTLRTHRVRPTSKMTMTPLELRAIREKLVLSQGVFASYLRTGETTYQNWEQGRSKPNNQAVLLIKMVDRNPNMLGLLAEL